MKMKKVRKCNGCKAYYQSHWRFECELGYTLTTVDKTNFMGVVVPTHRPEGGVCPKPKTLDELFKATEARQMLGIGGQNDRD